MHLEIMNSLLANFGTTENFSWFGFLISFSVIIFFLFLGWKGLQKKESTSKGSIVLALLAIPFLIAIVTSILR